MITIKPYNTCPVDTVYYGFEALITEQGVNKGRGYGDTKTEAVDNAHKNALFCAAKKACELPVKPADPNFDPFAWFNEAVDISFGCVPVGASIPVGETCHLYTV